MPSPAPPQVWWPRVRVLVPQSTPALALRLVRACCLSGLRLSPYEGEVRVGWEQG